jgi:glycosyltransferase involved in cell wall biosynthesis
MMVFRLSEELRRAGNSIVPVGPARGIGWLGDHFRRVGVTPEAFHLRRPIDPRCVQQLMKLFRDYRIEAVHSHEFTMAVYGAAAAKMMSLPHVITMHGGFNVGKVLRRRIALRWAMRNSAHTVMVSRATQAQYAAELKVDESSFTVVPNGVPIVAGNSARVRAEFGIRDGECVMLAVGTLERHKGHQLLLEAVARMVAAGVDTRWKLIIAGGRGGDQHGPLLDYVREKNLCDRVSIVLNRADVADLLALADIFVMPSLWEGLPMAVLEAMTAEKAIVATATAGIPEAIVDTREGLLVPPGDAVALADALTLLVADPVHRDHLARAAAARARREFSVAVMAERYQALYASAYNQRQRKISWTGADRWLGRLGASAGTGDDALRLSRSGSRQ